MLKKKELINFAREIIREQNDTIKDLIKINEDAVRQLNQVIYEFRKYIESQNVRNVKDKR